MKFNNGVFIKRIGYAILGLVIVYCVSLLAVKGLIAKRLKGFEQVGRQVRLESFLEGGQRSLADHENAAFIYRAFEVSLRTKNYDGPSQSRNAIANGLPTRSLFEVMVWLSGKILCGYASDEEIREFRSITELPSVEESLFQLGEIAQKEGCQFERDLKPDDLLYPEHIVPMRCIMQVVGAISSLNEKEKKEGLWSDLVLSLQVSNAMESDLTFFSHIVREHHFGLVTDIMIKALDHSQPSVSQIEEIEKVLKSFESTEKIRQGLDVELATARTVLFKDVFPGGAVPTQVVSRVPVIRRLPYYLDYLAYLSRNQYYYESLSLVSSSEVIEDYHDPFYANLIASPFWMTYNADMARYTHLRHARNLKKIKDIRSALQK